MKTAHCLECDQDRQVPGRYPDKIICSVCCGPVTPIDRGDGERRGLLLRVPGQKKNRTLSTPRTLRNALKPVGNGR